MTDQHPLTPPPELIEDWIELAKPLPQRPPNPGVLATLAARWGADMELEACCEWLDEGFGDVGNFPAILRTARRPKPKSLKEQALAALSRADKDALTNPLTGKVVDLRTILSKEQSDTIRRALEALPND
jgi:hypothetical protein